DIRLAHEHDLEATFERWVFLDVSAIFVQGGGADGAQLSAGERGLEHVGSVNRAFASTCADERVKLIDEQDDLALRVFDFFQNGLQAVFELATILRAGEHGAQIKGNDALIFQNFRDVTRDDALSKAFNNGGLADAGLADQHGIVLGAARQHLHDPANFFVTADNGIELAFARLFGQVASVALERLVLSLGILVGDAL